MAHPSSHVASSSRIRQNGNRPAVFGSVLASLDLHGTLSMPKVDIIIPAYNAAHFLPEAIESVIAQTFPDWRILLVDDGSRDNTREILAPYIERLGPKLQYIYQENRGLPAARNTAIRHSTAEFLALLDADDVWLPRRLETSVARFNRPEIGLVYGFNDRIDANSKVLDVFDRRNKHAEGRVASRIYMRTLDLPCPTLTFRRTAVEEVGLFDETLRAAEDRDLSIRIALKYEVALVPEVIAHYRVSPGGMTNDPDRMLTAQLRFIDKYYGQPGCGFLARQIALSWMYRQRAEAFALKGQPQKALRSALRAFALYPLHFRNLRSAASLALQTAGLRRPPEPLTR